MPERTSQGGIRVGRGVGKGLYRVRHALITDHYTPLIKARSDGAVKLDLLLRCIALPGTGDRSGLVIRPWTYENLYDQIEPDRNSRPGRPEPEVVRLKRKWVANQLRKLEDRELVQVTLRPGRTSQLVVRRDDGSGQLYDDPGGVEPRPPYLTIHGSLLAEREIQAWGGAELAAYFACLLAELSSYRGGDPPRKIRAGRETWYRPLKWFSEEEWAPRERTRLSFSVTTLEKGMASLERRGMIKVERSSKDPNTGRRLSGPRNIYTDYFNRFDKKMSPMEVDELERLLDTLDPTVGGESFADTVIKQLSPEALARTLSSDGSD